MEVDKVISKTPTVELFGEKMELRRLHVLRSISPISTSVILYQYSFQTQTHPTLPCHCQEYKCKIVIVHQTTASHPNQLRRKNIYIHFRHKIGFHLELNQNPHQFRLQLSHAKTQKPMSKHNQNVNLRTVFQLKHQNHNNNNNNNKIHLLKPLKLRPRPQIMGPDAKSSRPRLEKGPINA